MIVVLPSPLSAPVIKVTVMRSTLLPQREVNQGRLDGRKTSTTLAS
jgi:hypothetical protein